MFIGSQLKTGGAALRVELQNHSGLLRCGRAGRGRMIVVLSLTSLTPSSQMRPSLPGELQINTGIKL